MLKIEHITKTNTSEVLLDALSLEIKKGETILFIGGTDSGAQILFKILCKLQFSDSGTITIDDVPLNKTQHKVGIVFKNDRLFSHINTIRNITLPLEKVLGYNFKTAQFLALELLHNYELGDKATLCINRLTPEERFLVAFIRTIALKPEIICFESPDPTFDQTFKNKIAKNIIDLMHEGHTILIATQDPFFVEKIPGMIYLMPHATIIESAPSHEYWQDPGTFGQLSRFLSGPLKTETYE